MRAPRFKRAKRDAEMKRAAKEESKKKKTCVQMHAESGFLTMQRGRRAYEVVD